MKHEPPSRQISLTNGRHTPPEPRRPITAAFVLGAVRRWWKAATPAALLLAGVAVGIVYLVFEPVYEASSWFQIREKTPYVAFPDHDQSRRFVETQIQLLQSPLVLAPVLSDSEISQIPELSEQEDPLRWLQKEIKAGPVGKSELFKVSFACSDPKNAARVVNAVTEAYFKLQRQDEAGYSQRVVELLEEEKKRREVEVKRLQDDVRKLTSQATEKDPFSAAGAAPGTVQDYPLANLRNHLTNVEVEKEVLEARIQAYEQKQQASQDPTSLEEAGVPRRVLENLIGNDPEVQRLDGLLAAQETKWQETVDRSAKGESDPFCLQLQEEINLSKKLLGERRNKLEEEFTAEMLEAMKGAHKEELEKMRSDLDVYERMAAALQARYKEGLLAKVEQSSEDTLNVQFKQAELARAEEVLDLISSRTTQLRTEQRAPARVMLRQPAEPPQAPVELLPYKKMIMFGLAAFCLPFVLVVLWERLIQRVSNSGQLEQHSHLAVVGEIARLPVRTSLARGSSSERIRRRLSMFEESIDGLRTCLMLAEPLRDMKVLAVTSAAKREGKTSVAAQLAVSMARASGEPTLLIDGDMRSPDVHNIFEVPAEPGLAEVLDAECDLKDAIVTGWSRFVHLLPAGKLHTSPHKLVGNGALKSLLDEVRKSYRYVVIDTPPILCASESLVLAKAADGSLVCAMRDTSRIDQVKKAFDRLVVSGGRPVGAVLNGVPESHYSYRYGTYPYSRG